MFKQAAGAGNCRAVARMIDERTVDNSSAQTQTRRHSMPANSLFAVATELVHAADAAAALAAVNRQLAASDRDAGLVLLTYDARRGALVNRALLRNDDGTNGTGDVPDRARMALDHLPAPVRYVLLTGERFADVGDQAAQYGRLVGVELAGTELRLLLKGIVVESALVAVIALYDTRRRGGGKLLERAEPLAGLFELAYARLYERDARFEAVAALHEITSRLRAEHASALAARERELHSLRMAQSAGTSDVVRQLRGAVAMAEQRAAAAEERLSAVEQQVVAAVDRLQRLHLQLAEQDATIRSYRETIRALQQQIAPGAVVAARS